MSKTMRTLIPTLLLLLLPAGEAQAGDALGPKADALGPQADVQRQLAEVTSTLFAHWDDQASEDDVRKAMTTLMKLRPHLPELLPQLVLYRVEVATDERKLAAATIIAGELMKELTDDQVLQAMVPYLDYPEADMRHETAQTLSGLLSRDDRDGSSFAPFESYLGERSRPSPSLVDYMYGTMPHRAFESLVRTFIDDDSERRALLRDAEALQRSAGDEEALGRLAGHRVWWVRRYAERMG